MERNDYLIKKKFYAYLIPGVLMVAALQLGNLLDSVFVGNILGMTALSASSLGTPVVFISQVPLMILATGGSTVAAVSIGRRENGKASKAFRVSFFGALAVHVLIAVSSLLFVPALASAFTSDAEMADLCARFMRLYLLAMPVLGAAFIMGYFMGVDNHPKESAAMHITANVINLALDYVFLAVLHTGIEGSVWSTIIGYAVSGAVFSFIYMRSGKRMLKFRTKEKETGAITGEIIKTGAASGILMLLNAIRIIILNKAVINITGTEGMAVYAVSINSMFLVQLCLHGIAGVVPTMGGILYGDRDHYGIRQLLKRAVRLSLIVSLILTALFMAAPGLIGSMFGFTSTAGPSELELCLRLFSVSFVFYALNIVAQSYYPAVEKPWYANLNTVLQGLVILIPVTLLLIVLMGVAGTGLASALAETLTFGIMAAVIRLRQKAGKERGRDLTLLPEKDKDALDITVRGTMEDAVGTARRIVDYCTDKGVERRLANAAAIAAEELVQNISSYSGQDERISFIDIRFTVSESLLILRVRDDGVFFDPVDYIRKKPFDEGDMDIRGLRLIVSLAEKIDYSRVLQMNNTVVEVAVRES